MKSYKKVISLSLIVTLLPILVGLLLWNRLPEQLPNHWNINGQIDGWMPKAYSVSLLPCLLALGQLVLSFVTFADPKTAKHPQKTSSGRIVDHPGSFLLFKQRNLSGCTRRTM